jgi:nitronate monooxygenase
MPNPGPGGNPVLRIKGKSLLPIVQGGMGVGISAHRLAGHVARAGAVGTLSSVDLRRHHPDLMAQTAKSRDKALINRVNLLALDREVRAALGIAGGKGLIAVNVMRAISEYAADVRQSCESGAGAIVVGAGLPLDLPDLTAAYPDVALIPILSDSRGIAILLKKWLRKSRLPDAIVIEHPRYAGGHLGAAKIADLDDPRFDFPRVLEETFAVFKELGIEREKVPLIPAGGIATPAQVRDLFALGASAVQVGTPFAVTEESDAHPNFKRVLADARPEDIVTFMSVAGLPARAVKTPWLEQYLAKLPVLQRRANARTDCTLAFDCLEQCGLRDGIARFGQFCIDHHLAAALTGDVKRGLFFRGAGPLPFGKEIRPVKDVIEYLLHGTVPADLLPAG